MWEVYPVPDSDGRYVFGTVKVGEKGQIVIPRDARRIFDFNPGDTLLVLGDERQGGIAIVKADMLRKFAAEIFAARDEAEEQ